MLGVEFSRVGLCNSELNAKAQSTQKRGFGVAVVQVLNSSTFHHNDARNWTGLTLWSTASTLASASASATASFGRAYRQGFVEGTAHSTLPVCNDRMSNDSPPSQNYLLTSTAIQTRTGFRATQLSAASIALSFFCLQSSARINPLSLLPFSLRPNMRSVESAGLFAEQQSLWRQLQRPPQMGWKEFTRQDGYPNWGVEQHKVCHCIVESHSLPLLSGRSANDTVMGTLGQEQDHQA
ncbi:hypothetical protein TcWFU_002735 [Taenia crassiceps]|uniref:Uncharacterized protein n=1 Tax=Taenia crassiceps TaxID=6207 RepID=A0ABR4QJV6_9CEST